MTKTEILKWLKKYDYFYGSNEYIINDDMSVDAKSSVSVFNNNLTKLPFKFNKIDGDFYCTSNNLTSLENCPSIINGNLFCKSNKLTSLKGIGYIGGILWCDDSLKDDVYYKSYLLLKRLRK